MHADITRLTGTEAAARLRRGEVSPLDLVEAAAARIAEVEPAVNALPTLCLDRARARPHGGRLLCQMPGFRRLDSLAVTAAGNICVAVLVAGEIATVSPAGEILDVVRCDERMPTNICFGGPDHRMAYITLSSTGRLLAMRWEERGLALAGG